MELTLCVDVVDAAVSSVPVVSAGVVDGVCAPVFPAEVDGAFVELVELPLFLFCGRFG